MDRLEALIFDNLELSGGCDDLFGCVTHTVAGLDIDARFGEYAAAFFDVGAFEATVNEELFRGMQLFG